MGENTGAAFVLIGIFYTCILIPCIGTAIIGTRLLERLGRFPSKTPVVQLSVLVPLTVLELVSFTLLIAFFKILVAE